MEWHLSIGFERVFAYAKHKNDTLDVPGVTWFVSPSVYNLGTPAFSGRMWYYGQPYTMTHCFHANLQLGTKWVMMIDVDEFVYPSLEKILSFAPEGKVIHGLSLGSIPVKGTKAGLKMKAGTKVDGSMINDFEHSIKLHNISNVSLAGASTCNVDMLLGPTELRWAAKCLFFRV